MRKNTIKALGNIGTIDLSQLDFTQDCLEVFIPIDSMSDGIKAEVNKAIEIDKIEHIKDMKDYLKERGREYNREWSKKGIIINYLTLHIVVDNKEFSYYIHAGYIDAVDECLWSDADSIYRNITAN